MSEYRSGVPLTALEDDWLKTGRRDTADVERRILDERLPQYTALEAVRFSEQRL